MPSTSKHEILLALHKQAYKNRRKSSSPRKINKTYQSCTW